MAIVKVSNRLSVAKVANNGDILEIGPGSTAHSVGTLMLQFAPSMDFAGTFQVLGKMAGPPGETAPFLPIPYRRVNINAAASDYNMVSDAVVPSAIIHVPSNQMTIALLANITAGQCQIYSWDLNGCPAI